MGNLQLHGGAALANPRRVDNIAKHRFTSEARLFDRRRLKNTADFFIFYYYYLKSSRARCQERCQTKCSRESERRDDRSRNEAITSHLSESKRCSVESALGPGRGGRFHFTVSLRARCHLEDGFHRCPNCSELQKAPHANK